MYASPEFLSTPEQFPNGKFPSPLWKQSGPEIEPEIAATKAAWTAGRLLSGALIPFALAYVYGIAFLLRRTNALAAPIAVAVLAALLLTSEIAINHVVFASEHNWFHR